MIRASVSPADMKKHALSLLLTFCLMPLAHAGEAAGLPLEGHYESECAKIAEEFYTRDVMDVGPGNRTVKVRYAKAMYGADGCKAADLLGLLELPDATWKLEGEQRIDGRAVRRVAVVIPAGLLRVTHARPGHVEESSNAWHIKTLSGEKVTVEKDGAMSSELDLRWLSPEGVLYLGLQASPRRPDGYLSQLDLDNPLRKLSIPSYASTASK
jgi:hypothetical protein